MPIGSRVSCLDDPRLIAVGNVLAVLEGCSLDDALARMPAGLDERDRALAAELSYGVCRWYRRLDALVTGLLRKPFKRKDFDLHALLLLGAYQLFYSRVPPHAALSTTVEATRRLGKAWAAKLVNGVLRRLQRDYEALATRVDADEAISYAQPDWLYRATREAWPEQYALILGAMQRRPPLTLRVDLNQVSRAAYVHRLTAAGIAAREHATVPTALVLDSPVGVDRLPGFSQGLVSVQDAGAQLAGGFLDLQSGLQVLDACAAPGGKTLDILQRAPGLHVTALDIDAGRLARVAENLARAGCAAELRVGDASDPSDTGWGSRRYDRILIDAPCSATGVIRRHPDIRLLRRADDVGALVLRQATILDAMWSLLVPGGRLVYATCSLLPAENAQQIDAFCRRHQDAQPVELPATTGIRAGKGVQLLPGIDDTDGFFYAALRRPRVP
jgi:16S rRNA (cytosine967-C5)-methyltransferase